jgi:DNA-binding response OmpR family regulator
MTRPIALVVEDDPRLQATMTEELEKAKFLVLGALDFEAAVAHLSRHKPHVICVDLSLPTRSGYELCEHIRSRHDLGPLPILVTSDRSFPEDMAYAEVAGANLFLKKPFAMKELVAHLSALVEGPPLSRPCVRTLCLSASSD